MKILGNIPSADIAASRDSFSSQMQYEVLLLFFFSPHFIDDTLNTKAECVKDSLICGKYMFLAKTFALRAMGTQLVRSPNTAYLSLFAINAFHFLDLFYKDHGRSPF